MDMRSKAYPALPEGRGLRLVLPRVGDLRFRPQIPLDFAQLLYIHADPRRRFWYARFQVKRKFIVMSTQGDLYAKTSVATVTMADLPKKNVLSMPRVARGDLVKVLDLVQCSRSEGQSWELVFTRWRNGMETWLPLEVVQLFSSNLLQEFYVNSINSWAFHSRVQPGNLVAFRTEVELWLFHSEFQEFYARLRLKRASGNANSNSQQRAGNQVRVKPESATTSTNSVQMAPAPSSTPVTQQPVPVAATQNDPSEAVIQEFEQRRLAREQQDQARRIQQQRRLQQRLAQEQAEQQRRLDRERVEQERRTLEEERERQLQHERQQQKAREELHKSQKEYQQRLRVQQEREKMAELKRKEQERLQRAKEQEQLRQRLQQDKFQQDRSSQKQTPTSRRPQDTTGRKLLRHKEPKKNALSHSNSHQPKERNGSAIWKNGGDDEYIPTDGSESDDSDSSADSEASEESFSDQPIRKRRRKRLLYSQVALDDEDEDDDLPDLSHPPPSTRRRNVRDGETSVPKPTQTSKKRKRLQQHYPSKENGATSTNVGVDLTQLSDGGDDEEEDNSLESPPETAVITPEGGNNGVGVDKTSAELFDDDGDADGDDNLDFEPSIIIGEIRCVCGATSVEGYRGQWLQCWNEDCGVWEHADCVGFLTSFENHSPPKYLCTRCDSEAYLARSVKASKRILDWLFQCCDSRNTKQLMELLQDNTGAANIPSDWKNPKYENRTLAMHAARNGLVKCLRYLLDERKVDIFETDLQSRNALHHAAIGGSVACCRILLKHDQKLLLHQDLRGCMPFHCMLQSAKVNHLCIPFMREDPALVGMGDLNSNYPIHFACQAVNKYTVEICRMIFAARSSMLREKSSEGLYPLMILCKSAGTATMVRSKTANASEVAKNAKDVITLMLDIDVFGDCLSQNAPNGWSSLHFAAASGNHELVAYLCNLGLFDVHHAAKESGQTALHIAAQENHPLCVRVLLLEGLNVVAKDNDGWIPMVYAEDAACVQEFMHYKLTKQLSRLHQMLGKYQQRGLVRRWQRCVARNPICFDILNDWCQSDPERIERMEGLLLSNPFLLRLDNKIEYVWSYIIPSIKSFPGQYPIGIENGKTSTKKSSRVQKKLAFVFARGNGCFWKQFVEMGTSLEPEDFRFPIIFSVERSDANSQGVENRDNNLKLILIRLAAGLLQEAPGLLARGSNDNIENVAPPDKQGLIARLLGFYLLGELVAHFVLFSAPISGILDFTPAFLRCIGCSGKYRLPGDELWETAGRSFTEGFNAVLPATLELFHADDLRVLFYGPEMSLNALQIDWNTAVDWDVSGFEGMGDLNADNAKTWLPRLMSELVEEEQQLLLLFMTGTFQLVNERFFRSEGGSDRITIAPYPETDDVFDQDAMYPTMEHEPDILRLPSYSGYDAFKKGVLTAIRYADQAFLPE